jgi:hypothetical protein
VPRLGIDKTFLGEFAKLEKPVQASVLTAIGKFGEHTHAGLHLETINSSRDPRLRTIRIDIHWRGVVLAPDKGDEYCLLTVLPHDKAIAFAKSHRPAVNQVLGVFEVRNEGALDEVQPALTQAAEATDNRLFARVSDADLTRLGIDSKVLRAARAITSQDALDAILPLVPEAQATALTYLACDMSVEDVWQEVAQYLATDTAQQPIDTNDLSAAMKRTPSQVVFVNGHEELQRILADPFGAWRIFLHPAQRKIALAPRYAGPVQVTGGAGTGKTVTALHRTTFLAERATTQLFSAQASETPPILLTTFTRNLAESLATQLASLTDNEDVRAQVEILNVDSLANHVVTRGRGSRPVPADENSLRDLWAATATQPFSATFLTREWEQVILAQDLHTEQDYLACSRAGQGTPLGKAQRSQVWRIIQQVVAGLQKQGQSTYLQLANEAAHIVRQSLTTPYQHVIVDEAQDLHPAQWRLLRAIVAPGPDDMFIVGDPHQRIYENRVSLASLGISVRGRSRRLTMNYRTTQEILAWAVPRLGKQPVTGLDDDVDTLIGYRSPMHGRPPEIHAASTVDEELSALAAKLRGWLAEGIEPHAIGIAARTGFLVKQARASLEAEGIDAATLSAKGKRNAVRVGTMHAMKGLEFQAVAVIGVCEGTVPMPKALTPVTDDPVAHALDMQRERCLLFVACTRARDHLYVSYHATASPFLQ